MSEFWETALGITVAVLAFILLVGGFFLGVRQVSHHFDVNRCEAFQVKTGRETRFVDYTFWSWDCLTRAKDGKWLPINQLRDIQ